MRLINADDLLNKFKENALTKYDWNDYVDIDDLKDVVDSMPTIKPINRSYLSDWYIHSVDDSEPVWTEAHLDELFNDFYLIPKENDDE